MTPLARAISDATGVCWTEAGVERLGLVVLILAAIVAVLVSCGV